MPLLLRVHFTTLCSRASRKHFTKANRFRLTATSHPSTPPLAPPVAKWNILFILVSFVHASLLVLLRVSDLLQLRNVAKPPESLIQLLTALCADPRNLVFVISGREKEEMQKALGDIKVCACVRVNAT